MSSHLPGPITGDLEGDIAIVILIGALILLLRVLDKKLPGTQRLGTFSIGVGLLSVSLALFIDAQRSSLPYLNAPVDYERAGIGQSHYIQNCMHCHGLDGRGAPEMGGMRPPDLTTHVFQHDDQYLSQIIANGRGTMPGFKDRLLPSQIGDVIHYMRVLGRKKQ